MTLRPAATARPRRRATPIFVMPTSRPTTTDELWFAPALAPALPPSRGDDTGNAAAAANNGDGGDDGSDFMEAVVPPSAREKQKGTLLSGDRPWSAALTGYDHTRWDDLDVMGGLDWIPDGRGDLDDDDDCDDLDQSIGREQGGGAWLLGSPTLLDLDPAAGWRALPPDLASASDGDSSAMSSRSGTHDASLPSRGRRGVSFAPTVSVLPIPHSSELSPHQKRRMFATTAEVRRNKARNLREFRHDGEDWRAATEERQMAVNLVTGELVHPAHCCDNDI